MIWTHSQPGGICSKLKVGRVQVTLDASVSDDEVMTALLPFYSSLPCTVEVSAGITRNQSQV